MHKIVGLKNVQGDERRTEDKRVGKKNTSSIQSTNMMVGGDAKGLRECYLPRASISEKEHTKRKRVKK